MRDVYFYLAQRTLATEPTEPIAILLVTEIPSAETLEEQDKRFQSEAEELCDELEKHLPGGVFDRLAVEILKRKASHFIVSHKE